MLELWAWFVIFVLILVLLIFSMMVIMETEHKPLKLLSGIIASVFGGLLGYILIYALIQLWNFLIQYTPFFISGFIALLWSDPIAFVIFVAVMASFLCTIELVYHPVKTIIQKIHQWWIDRNASIERRQEYAELKTSVKAKSSECANEQEIEKRSYQLVKK